MSLKVDISTVSENKKSNITLLKALKTTSGIELKTLDVIYWCRVGFGVIAALVCVLLIDVGNVANPLISGMSIGILVYLISYYVLKWRFMAKVEKQSKMFTMGIGAYFFAWIVCWVLFITPFLRPPIATFEYSPQNPVVGETIFLDASASYDPDGTISRFFWSFGDESDGGEGITATHVYTSSGNYTVTLTVKDDDGLRHVKETTLTVNLNVTS